jgi:hypothetical protein
VARSGLRDRCLDERDISLMRRPMVQSGLWHSMGITVRVATGCAASSAAMTTRKNRQR